MKTRYLFRAKRKDNGEWIVGYYLTTQEAAYICYNAQFNDDLFLGTKNIIIEVVPETVEPVAMVPVKAKLVGPSPVESITLYKCPNCGALFPYARRKSDGMWSEITKYCGNCGQRLDREGV